MILASGCFDGLHAGHVRYLQRAAGVDPAQSLTVALATDAYVKRVKGRDPRYTELERAHVVFALGCVGDVVFHNEDGAAAAILALKPQYFVKGIDWMHKLLPDIVDACHEVGAQIVFVDSLSSLHSSAYA